MLDKITVSFLTDYVDISLDLDFTLASLLDLIIVYLARLTNTYNRQYYQTPYLQESYIVFNFA